jgi:hypothetical protein
MIFGYNVSFGVGTSSCGPPCSPLNVRFGQKGITRATVRVAEMKLLSPSAVAHLLRIQAIQWSCHAHPPAPHGSVVCQRSLVSKRSSTCSVAFISLNTKDIRFQRRGVQRGCHFGRARTPGGQRGGPSQPTKQTPAAEFVWPTAPSFSRTVQGSTLVWSDRTAVSAGGTLKNAMRAVSDAMAVGISTWGYRFPLREGTVRGGSVPVAAG